MRSLIIPLRLRPKEVIFNVYRDISAVFYNNKLCYGKLKILSTSTNNLPIAKYRFQVNSEKNGYDESKAKLVLQLNFRSAEDALPFYKLPVKTLLHISKVMKVDQASGFCENRLYYISSRIKCRPSELSERLAKRTFIYSLSFEWLENSLNVLLEMGVSGDRILRDLWVLKYHHKTIHNRLQRIKDLGVDHLYPWMVRCPEDVLNRTISLSQETKTILGDIKSTETYLANRLNISLKDVEDMCIKLPALRNVRVTKVKPFLDFLISEGFDIEEIATKPRILFSSLKTVKQRLEKLRKLGLNEINLNVLCRSRKDFKKYCESLESASRNSEECL